MKYSIETAAGDFREPFLAYCAEHAKEHDDSFIPGANWPDDGDSLDGDHPSFVLLEGGSVAGVAAGLFTPSFRHARKIRFAVLHALVAPEAAAERYASLAAAIASSAQDSADSAYLFFPEGLADLRATLEEIGFRFERTAYLMGRGVGQADRASFPSGYSLSAIARGDEGGIAEFVSTRNRNFREVLGSSDAFAEDIRNFMDSGEFLSGGLALLRAPDGSACGTLRVERDDEEGAGFIGTVSVDTRHRRLGLGSSLIRHAVEIGRGAGFSKVYLSVNAENGKALSLYLNEGFTVIKAMTCMTADLPALTGGREERKR